MKRLVTLIAVAALLGTVAVSYAQTQAEIDQAEKSDTLHLNATVAPYGAIWFGDEDEGAGDLADDDSLVFAFDTIAVENGTAATEEATLHFRANYSVYLDLEAQAPTLTVGGREEEGAPPMFDAVLVTDVKLVGGDMVGGSHDGFPVETYIGTPSWSLWPGQESATNSTPVSLATFELSPWMKNGMDLDLEITVKPEIYRWDAGPSNQGRSPYTGWAMEGYLAWDPDGTPATSPAIYSGDDYRNPDTQTGYVGYLKATLTSQNLD